MSAPGPEVVAAAAVVQKYLDAQPPARVSDEQYKAMTSAQKLDYARKFTQHLESGRRATRT
jgi:hypothetical protein